MDCEDEPNLQLHCSRTEGNAYKLYLEWGRLLPEQSEIKIATVLEEVETFLTATMDHSQASLLIERLAFLRLTYEFSSTSTRIADQIFYLFSSVVEFTKMTLFHQSIARGIFE